MYHFVYKLCAVISHPCLLKLFAIPHPEIQMNNEKIILVLQNTVNCRYYGANIVIHYINDYGNWEYASEAGLKKDIPYLALTGELWGVFWEYLWENWPRYSGTARYCPIPRHSPLIIAFWKHRYWLLLPVWSYVINIKTYVNTPYTLLLAYVCRVKEYLSSYTETMYVFLPVTEIQAAAYFDNPYVIDRTIGSAADNFIGLVDRENSTCLHVELDKTWWLQAMFKFHDYVIGHEIAIEVVMKNEEDCSSVSWSWFAGSSCILHSFKECQKFTIGSSNDDGYSRCVIKCACMATCDHVYLKYMNFPSEDQSEQQLCDVYLIYHGAIKPDARGLLP